MPTITVVDKSVSTAPTTQAPTLTVGKQPLSNSQQSARDKAIAALLGGSAQPTGNAQETPVQDPTSVSIEEVANLNTSEQNSGQSDNSVEDQSEALKTSDEAPSTQEATNPTKEEPLSTQYAMLARREKAIRAKAVQQEQTFKQREAELARREAELSSKSTIDTSKYISIDDLKRNALGKLQEHGISYDEISQQALSAQSPEAQAIRDLKAELQDELRKVREEQDKIRKSSEEQQTQSYQQALRQIEIEASQIVSSDPSYETIRETGSVKDVVGLIERTFQEDGTLLTVEQAAQMVEEHLIEEALKLARLQKIQARLKPVEPKTSAKPAEKSQPQPTQQQPAAQMKTLTNSMGNTRQLSARERAILAMKGELK